MNRAEFLELISAKIKVARVEAGLTQERMAELLGVSKKTLVQLEKGRIQAGWPVAVTFCTLFRDSELLRAFFGSDLLEIISVLAFNQYDVPSEKTLGGKIWWREVEVEGGFRLQQNLVSKHFRILDEQNRRWYSSFNEQEMSTRLKELASRSL